MRKSLSLKDIRNIIREEKESITFPFTKSKRITTLPRYLWDNSKEILFDCVYKHDLFVPKNNPDFKVQIYNYTKYGLDFKIGNKQEYRLFIDNIKSGIFVKCPDDIKVNTIWIFRIYHDSILLNITVQKFKHNNITHEESTKRLELRLIQRDGKVYKWVDYEC